MSDDVLWYTTVSPFNVTPTTVQKNNSVESDFSSFTILNQVICGIVSPLGIIGNTLVLFAFLPKWSKLKTYELFIVSLACADLLGTLVFPCIQLHELSGGSFNGIGSNGCKVIFFLSSTSIFVSSFTLIVVSLDRYIAVKWPFKRRQRLCRILIVLSWIIGFSSAMVYLVTDRIQLLNMEANGVWLCRYTINTTEDEQAYKALTVFTFTTQNIIPFVVMSIFYSLIIFELRKNTDRNLTKVSDSEMHRRRNDVKKTTKLLFVVVVVFFICVTPYNIFYILYTLDKLDLDSDLDSDLIHRIYVVLSMLMMCNSCVNPLIYGKLLRPFRRRSWKLFVSFLNCTGMKIQQKLYSMKYSRTLRTSVSKYETDYSRRGSENANNNNNDNNNTTNNNNNNNQNNFTMQQLNDKGAKPFERSDTTMNGLQRVRKIAMQHDYIEPRYGFDMNGNNLLPLLAGNLADDLVMDEVCSYQSSDGTSDRETIL